MATQQLIGKSILLSREDTENRNLARHITDDGGRVFSVPLIERMDIDPADFWQWSRLVEEAEIISFQSVKAAKRFADLLGVPGDRLAGKRIIAVGERTASILESVGIPVSDVPSTHSAEGILAHLPADLGGIKVLLPGAADPRPELEVGLRSRGAVVTSIPLYQTRLPAEAERQIEQVPAPIHAIVCYSPSAVQGLFAVTACGNNRWLRGVPVVTIGKTTAETVVNLGLRLGAVAKGQTEMAVRDAILQVAWGGARSNGGDQTSAASDL